MTRILGISYFILASLFVAGCVPLMEPDTRFIVHVDSLVAPMTPDAGSYILVPVDEGANEKDLQYREYAAYVHFALETHGYRMSGPDEVPDMVIGLGFGISDPATERYSYSAPIWGQTGVASASTYGNTTYFTPSYGVTGHIPQSATLTTFARHLWLAAYSVGDEPEELWRTFVHSTGSSGDLRRVFPILVAAGGPYLGKNSVQSIRLELSEDDDEVVAMKAAVQQAK